MKNRSTKMATLMGVVALLTSLYGCGSGMLTGIGGAIAGSSAISVDGGSTAAIKRASGTVIEMSANVGQIVSMPIKTSASVGSTLLVSSGAVPAGLSLSRNGLLMGTPNSIGVWKFSVGAPAVEGQAPPASQNIAFTVLPAALIVRTGSLPAGQSGSPYSVTLQADGGTPGYTWTLSNGKLPLGLSLSRSGTLSGTPAVAGSYEFTLGVNDSGAPTLHQSRRYTLNINPSPLSITSTSVGNAQVNTAYSTSLSAVGGTPAYRWSMVSGSLPSGVTFSGAGVISGTPAVAGNFAFTAAVTDSSAKAQMQTRQLSLTVLPSSLAINSNNLSGAQVGTAYAASLTAMGGTPSYTWALSSGNLPAGLTLGSSGAIAGTPTTPGTSSFTVAVSDAGNPQQRQIQNLTLTVAPTTLTMTTGSLGSGQIGTAYSASMAATGGTPGYSWSVASGSLPAGLGLSSTGVLSGTPSAAGTSSFSVALVDQGMPAQRQTKAFSITIASSALTISTAALATAQPGIAYTSTLQASGGTPGYTWTLVIGNLPDGLTLSSNGALSGTLTSTARSAAFAVQVADAGSPAQTQLKGFSLLVAPGVAITSTGLGSGQSGSAYSSTLNAAGGTPGYTWSLIAGSLPSGLTLSSTGVISGTPQVAGTSAFTVAVNDSSTPSLHQTANLSLSITSTNTLSITSASLSSGQAGTSYSGSLSASGGTPAYTWSVQAGSLPAGLTLAATTGVISGKPSSAGTSSFTVAVSDNSTPSQVKTANTFITISQASTGTSVGSTWYVRPDGGTRYSDRITTGQCDGKSDAPYPGSGVNQSCAFSDVRYLWTDGSYCVDNSASSNCWKWIGSGGDTYLIRGSLASGVTYRIGQSGPNPGDSFGLHGNPYGAGVPVPPSGTASAHTRILGENYGSCSAQSAKTQLHGGYGVGQVLNLTGASYVDVACLDITDFSVCGRSAQTNVCHTSYPLDDYANNGILLNNQTNHTTLTDIRVHGMASSGLIGPTGDGVVMTGIELLGNASAGWNADGGDGQTGSGSLLVQHFNISWNGCAEEYPIVDALPYQDCTDDQSGGGYGDGFGTATVSSVPGWQAHFDQGIASYNTQDGLDALHLTGTGSSMTITRVLAYGNMGQQIKVGGASGTATNNVIFTNCNALRQAIPGTPAGYNSRLSDFCRAADEGVLFTVGKGSIGHFDFNTIYSASATGIDIQCDGSAGACDSTAAMTYRNNIFVGFKNDATSGYPAGRGSGDYSNPIYLASFNPFVNAGSAFSNNVTFHAKGNWACPATNFNESSGVCADPLLTDESWHVYGFGNVTPLSNNAVHGAGAPVSGVITDYTGATRNALPSIGAYE